MRARTHAVSAQEKRIQTHREEHDALHEDIFDHRKRADQFEVDLKEHQERVNKLRVALNAAKTNKEYAALLTEINTHKADNARIEEQELKLLSDIDELKARREAVATTVAEEEKRLEELKSSSAEEIARLEKMVEELTVKRREAAPRVPPDVLAVFERVAEKYDGEALAEIEINGRKPPYTYTCGGCYMSLNAEHANALRTKDAVRQCDNCQRILCLPPEAKDK
jgi:predicted  nucleic acid-binding Zn-ribbon protein